MSAKEYSNHPSAVRSRERRFDQMVKAQEADMYADVKRHMDSGMDFDAAWIAAGGLIVPCTSTPALPPAH